MRDRNGELLKSTLILSIGQIVPKFLTFIILPILTTYLTQRDYGLYELTMSVASFCIPMFSLQIQQGVFRYLIENKINKENIITDSFYFLILIFVIFSLPVVGCWYLYTKSIYLSTVFFLAYFFEMLLTWAGQTVRGLGDNVSYSMAYICYSVCFFAVLVCELLLNKTLSIYNVVAAMIISYALSAVFLLVKDKLYSYICLASFDKKVLKVLLAYSIPMVISSAALWIVNLSDRFFVSGMLGVEVTAVYAVANKVPNLFNSFYGIFNLAWTENTSKLTKDEKSCDYYSLFFKSFYNVMVGLMLLLICAGPIIFKILINSKYNNAYSLMPWLYIGVFFSSLVSFLGSIYIGEKRTKDVGVSSAVGAVINVLINLFFMKQFGIIVAALSTIISYAIIFVYRAIDIKKYVTIKYNLKSIVEGLITIIFVSIFNMEFSIIRWMISLIIMITYNWVFNRNTVVALGKKVMGKFARK